MDEMRTVAATPLLLTLAVIAALGIGLPYLAVYMTRRFWPYPSFKENNELVGFTYAVFGLIYGVLMAFTIDTSWERFDETKRLVSHEAALLSELWRNAQAFPDTHRRAIHAKLFEYTQSVVYEEWPTMAAQGGENPGTRAIYEALWAQSYGLDAQTKLQEAFLSQYLTRLNDLSETRRLRLLHSRARIPGILWLVLWAGGLPTVLYPLFFANKHRWVHVVITSFVAVIVLLNLLVIVSLQHPFTGEISVRPVDFLELLSSFEHRMMPAPP